MFLKIFTISCITSIFSSLPAIAGDYPGKCLSRVEQKYETCTISTSEETVQFLFEENPEANTSIPTSSILSVDEGQDHFVNREHSLSGSYWWRKVHEFNVIYSDEEGRKRLTSFRIKKKRATALRTDLINLSGVAVDRVR